MPFSVQRKWDSLTISTARKQQQWHDNERSQKVLLWKLLLWFKEPTKTGKRNYLNVTSAPQCCGYTQKRCFFPVLLCFNSYLMHKRLYLFSVTCRFPAMLCTVPVLAFLCMCTNDWRFFWCLYSISSVDVLEWSVCSSNSSGALVRPDSRFLASWCSACCMPSGVHVYFHEISNKISTIPSMMKQFLCGKCAERLQAVLTEKQGHRWHHTKEKAAWEKEVAG